ncbi:MAG: rod shape-determining protein MreC [Candidatus Andersenbacteria bacterium]
MQTRSIVALIILAVVLLGFAFLQTPIMRSIRDAAWTVATVTVARIGGTRIYPEEAVYTQLNELRAENVRLKSQLQEYARLQAQLGSPAFESYQGVAARVIARPLNTFQSQLVINKGIRDGITINAPAVINGSVLVGLVSEVGERSAVITSLLHPQTSLTVETIPQDSDDPAGRGLLESRNFTSLHMTTVPRDLPLQDGQAVVTTSQDTAIPGGLMLGSLTNIHNQEHEAYQQARVALPYDLDRVDTVTVLVAP